MLSASQIDEISLIPLLSFLRKLASSWERLMASQSSSAVRS